MTVCLVWGRAVLLSSYPNSSSVFASGWKPTPDSLPFWSELYLPKLSPLYTLVFWRGALHFCSSFPTWLLQFLSPTLTCVMCRHLLRAPTGTPTGQRSQPRNVPSIAFDPFVMNNFINTRCGTGAPHLRPKLDWLYIIFRKLFMHWGDVILEPFGFTILGKSDPYLALFLSLWKDFIIIIIFPVEVQKLANTQIKKICSKNILVTLSLCY